MFPSNYLKDLNVFSFFGLIFHFIFPRVGIFNDLAKNVILGNPLDYNLLIEIPHFLISYAFLGFLCHIALKKKEF